MRVVIAEDNPILRDGISLILTEHDMSVIAAVADAEDLLTAIATDPPDLAIIDVRMPPTHTDEGVRAALKVRAEHPTVAVLVFSQWIELTYARQLIDANPTKVGYLLKDRIISTNDFVQAARRVANGGTAFDPEVVNQLLARPTGNRQLAQLTDRERSTLALLAEGRSNQTIADTEHLALRSVEKIIAAIFTKLDLPPTTTDHRRVLAVLHYLNATGENR
jgi:DNA-binding NarL/FixJ family response regulator